MPPGPLRRRERFRHAQKLAERRRGPDVPVGLFRRMPFEFSDELKQRFPFVDVFLPPSETAPLLDLLQARGLFAEVRETERRDRALREAVQDEDLPLPAETRGRSVLADVPVRYLSTGQKKRAALARLIGQQAPLWLLDEPLNGLDTRGVELVERLVARHCAAGGIAVIASHQPITVPGLARIELKDFAA